MFRIISRWEFAVVLASVFSPVAAHYVPLDVEPREVCVENTVYLALQEYIFDADPWCRKELGILDVSSTVATVTARTTTTFTRTTTTVAKIETITVPSSTVTIIDVPSLIALPLQKRDPDPKAAASFQALSFIQSIDDGSASDALYADVISACKCLRLQPRIDYVIATVSVARTLRAIDWRQTTSYVTVTAGVATEYETPSEVLLISTSIAKSNLSLISETTIPGVRTRLLGTGLPVSTSTRILPLNITTTVTISPIPSLTLNVTRSLHASSVLETGLSANVASIKHSALPANSTDLVHPTVTIPVIRNSTVVTPAPSGLANATYILPIITKPTKTASVNASTLIDLDLIIRDPRLPAICQSLFSTEINPVRTVLSTIVSTSVRTTIRTSILTSVITSVRTAVFPKITTSVLS